MQESEKRKFLAQMGIRYVPPPKGNSPKPVGICNSPGCSKPTEYKASTRGTPTHKSFCSLECFRKSGNFFGASAYE